MKQGIFLVASLGFLAGMTNATPPDSSQREALRFMDAFSERMIGTPTDGDFGMRRLPAIHIRELLRHHDVSEPLAAISKDHYFGVFATGVIKDGVPSRFNTQSGYWNLEQMPWEWYGSMRAAYDSEAAFVPKYLNPAASKLLKMKRQQAHFEEPFVGGRRVVIEARKIFASSDACLKCHADVKRGEPIGVIGLARIKRDAPKR